MPMNKIQFQPGLSLPQFQQQYGTDAQCEQALIESRWPQGWRCPRCNAVKAYQTHSKTQRKLWECVACGHQCSSTSGTVFERSKLGLHRWFLALYFMTQSKNATSILELKRLLGVAYETAWLVKHKLLQVMEQRDKRRRLDGRLEVDDAYLGGERAGHMHGGRGALNKTAFVAAVQTSDDGHPLYMRLTPVAGFTIEAIKDWASRTLAPSAHVVSDGTACFAHVTTMGATHERHVTGGGRKAAQHPQFRWVNVMLGNLKTALNGTYHSIKHQKYAARYLAEFCYRFNRRFDLPAMIPRLLRAAVLSPPRPMRVSRLGLPELSS